MKIPFSNTMDKAITKTYTNGTVTVVWKPDMCIHSGICLKGLPKVFNLKKRPWVNMDGATSEEIVKAVRACPSKALSIKGVRFKEESGERADVTLIPGGPVIVKGGAIVKDRNQTENFEETVAFCRCGRSGKFPYCDGTHARPKDV